LERSQHPLAFAKHPHNSFLSNLLLELSPSWLSGNAAGGLQIDQAAQALAEQQLADAANEPLPDNDDDELLEG
jgi:hypothetical protein